MIKQTVALQTDLQTKDLQTEDLRMVREARDAFKRALPILRVKCEELQNVLSERLSESDQLGKQIKKANSQEDSDSFVEGSLTSLCAANAANMRVLAQKSLLQPQLEKLTDEIERKEQEIDQLNQIIKGYEMGYGLEQDDRGYNNTIGIRCP